MGSKVQLGSTPIMSEREYTKLLVKVQPEHFPHAIPLPGQTVPKWLASHTGYSSHPDKEGFVTIPVYVDDATGTLVVDIKAFEAKGKTDDAHD